MISFDGYLYKFHETLPFLTEKGEFTEKKWVLEVFPAVFYQMGTTISGILVAEYGPNGTAAEVVKSRFEYEAYQNNLRYYCCWSKEKNVPLAVRTFQKIFTYQQTKTQIEYEKMIEGLEKALEE